MQISLAPDLSLLVIMVIFWLNYLVVRKFFLQPVNEVVESREREAKTAEQLYEESLARFNEATARMEAQLHAARRDAAQIREKFRGEAAEYRNEVLDRTSSEAKATLAEAETRLSQDVVAVRKKIVSESESLARLAAERILGRPV
jgi:F0F1-type ATP synthase membrane subunit b/b'